MRHETPRRLELEPRSTAIAAALPFLTLGFASQVVQIVFIREFFTQFSGSEIAIAIVLGGWLIGIASGTLLAALLFRGIVRPLYWYSLLTIVLCIIVPFVIATIRMWRGLLDIHQGALLSIGALFPPVFALLLIPCAIFGMQFVLAVKMTGSTSGPSVYIAESIGGLAGGLLTTFLLLPSMDHMTLAVASVGLHAMATIALSFSSSEQKGRDAIVRALLLIAVPLCGLLYARDLDRSLTRRFWANFNDKLEIVETRNSWYGTIALVKYGGQYSIYQSGQLLFSLPNSKERAPLPHLIMLQHKHPERVLLIGGGLSGGLKEIVKYNVTAIDYLELDPAIIEIGRKYADGETTRALDDGRVRIHNADARLFLKERGENYDAIIVNGSDPTTAQANRFFTSEFYADAKRRLRNGGILAVGAVVLVPQYQGNDLLLRNCSLFATIRGSFADVLAVSPAGYFLASDEKKTLSLDETEIIARAAERIKEEINLYPFLNPNETAKVNYELTTGRSYNPLNPESAPHGIFPLNSDYAPIVYYYTILLWAHIASDSMTGILAFFLGVGRAAIVIVLVSICALALLYQSLRRGRGFPCAFALFTSGLVGMAMEMLLIFAYQNVLGYVYRTIGILIALFMAGLAAGALVSARWPERRATTTLAASQAFNGLFALALPFLIEALAEANNATIVTGGFISLAFVAGFLTSIPYPLACKVLALQGNDEGRGAGLLYGCDIFGGFIGALFVGSILLPLHGFAFACATTTILSFGGAIILLATIVRPSR